MYQFSFPFSMSFKGSIEKLEKVTLSENHTLPERLRGSQYLKALKLTKAIYISGHEVPVDILFQEFEICNQLNLFIAYTEKREARVESVEKKKGWIGVSNRELKHFHMRNLIAYLSKHSEYCTIEAFEMICHILFPIEYIELKNTDKVNKDYFEGMLDAVPVDDHDLDRIFSKYSIEKQERGETEYQCEHIIDVPFATLHYIFQSGNIIKKCSHCGKIFVPTRSSEQYCNGESPEYIGKSCKEAAKYKKQLEREGKNPIHQEYKRTYNALYRRTLTADRKRQEYAQKHLKEFMANAKKMENKLGEQEYIKWLISMKNK